MRSDSPGEKPKICIDDFISKAPADMHLKLLAGAKGIRSREIVSSRIQKLGLALAGFAHYIHAGRLQMVGQSEIWYLTQLEPQKRTQAIRNLDLEKICGILITKSLDPPQELIDIAEEFGLPVIQTSLISSSAINAVTKFLQEVLAPQVMLHGVLMSIYGMGVLIVGESGIGKSECALDLISRGHRLVSDDVVIVKRIGDKLEGVSPELTSEHLEIRGLGILNVRELFGVTSIQKSKEIELSLELKPWDSVDEIERLGLETMEEEIFGLKLSKFILPVSPGRNISTLVETATRVHLLRLEGHDAAQNLIEKHTKMLLSVSEKD